MTTKNIEAVVSRTMKVKSALDYPPGPGKTNHNETALKVHKGVTSNHNETLLKVVKTAAYPPGPTLTNHNKTALKVRKVAFYPPGPTITIVNHNEAILKIYK